MKRTAIFTFLMVLALAAAPAFAALNTAAGVTGTPPDGNGRQALLYDQTDNAAGNGAPDQDFEASYDAYDSEGADDFDVTWTDGWLIQQIQTVGTTGGVANAVNVTFYSDNSGFPGSQICSYPGASFTDNSGSLVIDFADCFAGMGVAWVAIQVQQDFATAGQHFWSNRSTQTLSESVWRNPGDGFGTGCTNWDRQATVCGVGGGASPDFLFQVWGEEAVGPTPTPDPGAGGAPIPTTNRYGIIAMMVLLIGVAVVVIMRRK